MDPVQATLEAARIQANYAVLATIVGAFIGALGIIFAAWFAWKTGMKLHEHNSIVEAKRDIYLQLIEAWFNYLMDVNLFMHIVDRNEYFKKITESRKYFLSAANKASFISSPHLKKDIYSITVDFTKHTIDITQYIIEWYDTQNKDRDFRKNIHNSMFENLKEISKAMMELQIKLRSELGMVDDPLIDKEIAKMQEDLSKFIKM